MSIFQSGAWAYAKMVVDLRARCTEAKSYRFRVHGGGSSRWIGMLLSERETRPIGTLWLSMWEIYVYSAAVVILLWFLWTVVICNILLSLVIIWNFFGGYELWLDGNFTMLTYLQIWAPAPAFGIVQWYHRILSAHCSAPFSFYGAG